MENEYLISSISPATFQDLLEQYSQVVSPELLELEHRRLDIIPGVLAQRREQGDPHLTQDEVISLVEWKLSHGTFRPSLRSLVSSNSGEQILRTTREAFALLPRFPEPPPVDPSDPNFPSQSPYDPAAEAPQPIRIAQVNQAVEDPKTHTLRPLESPDLTPAISKLSTLRGIGPATASLVLNTFNQVNIPFFSDELFRWIKFADPEDKKGKGTGWTRKIGYTIKEYAEVVRRIGELRTNLEYFGRPTTAVEVELVAYVLGKKGIMSFTTNNHHHHHEAENTVPQAVMTMPPPSVASPTETALKALMERPEMTGEKREDLPEVREHAGEKRPNEESDESPIRINGSKPDSEAVTDEPEAKRRRKS